MDGLLTMATQTTDDVLALVLESLRIVMSVRKWTCLVILKNSPNWNHLTQQWKMHHRAAQNNYTLKKLLKD